MTDFITLTADDVDALRAIPRGITSARRALNSYMSRRYALVADYREGYGWALTIIETREMPEGYEPRTVDRRTRIAVNGRNEVYRANTAKRFVCSADAYMSVESTPVALGNLVKVGDALHVRFRIGNNTEAMKAAGFEHDECDVLVTRGAKVIAIMRLADVISNNAYNMADHSYDPAREGDVA